MASNQIFPLFIFSTLLIAAFVFAIVSSLIIQKQRQVNARLAKQQLEFDFSQSLLNTRVEVREATLNMVSRELHDHITQTMTGCLMQVRAAILGAKTDGGLEQESLLNDTREQLMQVITDVRLLSHSLATGMVEHRELQESIQAELDRIQRFSNISCSLRSDTFTELLPEQRLLAFRVVQETLQNVLKHAAAKNIFVTIETDEENDLYYLTVKDDGIGFDSSIIQSGSSCGLMNIKERASMLKGNIHIHSVPQEGTTIRLQIPLNTNA